MGSGPLVGRTGHEPSHYRTPQLRGRRNPRRGALRASGGGRIRGLAPLRVARQAVRGLRSDSPLRGNQFFSGTLLQERSPLERHESRAAIAVPASMGNPRTAARPRRLAASHRDGRWCPALTPGRVAAWCAEPSKRKRVAPSYRVCYNSSPLCPATRLKASASAMWMRRRLSSTIPSSCSSVKARVTASRLTPIIVPSCWWV